MNWHQLSNEDLQKALHETGTVILVGVPVGLSFGCDLNTWVVGNQPCQDDLGPICGVKLIPPGVRFLHFRRGKDDTVRSSFFLHVVPGAVHVRFWDPVREDFGPLDPVGDQTASIRQQIFTGTFDNRLVPYDGAQYELWSKLSPDISIPFLSHCQVVNGQMVVPGNALDEESQQASLLQRLGLQSEQRMVPKQANEPSAIRYSYVPYLAEISQIVRMHQRNSKAPVKDWKSLLEECIIGEPVSTSTLTKLHFDRSAQLTMLVKSQFEDRCEWLLAEVELSFLCFLLLSCWNGLDQWKRLVDLSCHSSAMFIKQPDVLQKFVVLITAQLQLLPETFFAEDLTSNNFLVQCLEDLISTCASISIKSSIDVNLEHSIDTMRVLLKERFSMEIEIQDEVTRDESEALAHAMVVQQRDAEEKLARLLSRDGRNTGTETCHEIVESIPENSAIVAEQSENTSKSVPSDDRMAWMLGPLASSEKSK